MSASAALVGATELLPLTGPTTPAPLLLLLLVAPVLLLLQG
jgi:hypothetical protein